MIQYLHVAPLPPELVEWRDRIEALEPAGRFRPALEPDRAKSYVAIAGGSGITPILSIVGTLLADFSNLRLVRVAAGPARPIEKEEIVPCLPEFGRNMRRFVAEQPGGYDLIHSHYWQSGWAGTLLARELGLPHVVMFHTLGEVKNRARFGEEEPRLRIRHERTIARRASGIITASSHERQLLQRYYGADPARMPVLSAAP